MTLIFKRVPHVKISWVREELVKLKVKVGIQGDKNTALDWVCEEAGKLPEHCRLGNKICMLHRRVLIASAQVKHGVQLTHADVDGALTFIGFKLGARNTKCRCEHVIHR